MDKTNAKLKYFHYSQNNSGGSHTGPAIHVIVAAHSAEEADNRAEDLGIYFNGCETGQDCGCCGDRWCNAYTTDGEDKPLIYDRTPAEYVRDLNLPREKRKTTWAIDWSSKTIPFAIIYNLNGKQKVYKTEKNK